MGRRAERNRCQMEGVNGKSCLECRNGKVKMWGGDLSISQSRKNSSTSMSHLKTEWFILVTGRSHFFFLPETSRIIDCNTTEKQSIPLYVSCQKSQNSARGNTHRAKRCLPSKLLSKRPHYMAHKSRELDFY